jgi:hypothetical protein
MPSIDEVTNSVLPSMRYVPLELTSPPPADSVISFVPLNVHVCGINPSDTYVPFRGLLKFLSQAVSEITNRIEIVIAIIRFVINILHSL